MNRRVIAAVDDLIFAARIRGTAEQLGIKTDLPQTADAILDEARREPPALFVIDLHARFCDPFALAARLKGDAQLREVPVVGFFSHVQTELLERARLAGMDYVMPRSAFTRKLSGILRGEL
jgi:PleD family two-component response regulator